MYICNEESCREDAGRPSYGSFNGMINAYGEAEDGGSEVLCNNCGYGADWCDNCDGNAWCEEHDPEHGGVGDQITSRFSEDVEWIKAKQ